MEKGNSICVDVSILNECNKIERVPLETLDWQGLPEAKSTLMEKSAMSRDNGLILLMNCICILCIFIQLYKIDAQFFEQFPLTLFQ